MKLEGRMYEVVEIVGMCVREKRDVSELFEKWNLKNVKEGYD